MHRDINLERMKSYAPKHIEAKPPPSNPSEIDDRFKKIKKLKEDAKYYFMSGTNLYAISCLQQGISHLMFYESVRTGEFQLEFNISPQRMEKIRRELANLYRFLGKNYFNYSRVVHQHVHNRFYDNKMKQKAPDEEHDIKGRRKEMLRNAEYCCDKALGIVVEPRAYHLRSKVRHRLRKLEEAREDIRLALKMIESTPQKGGDRYKRELENFLQMLKDDNGTVDILTENDWNRDYRPRLFESNRGYHGSSSSPEDPLDKDRFREKDIVTAVELSAKEKEERDLQEAILLSLRNVNVFPMDETIQPLLLGNNNMNQPPMQIPIAKPPPRKKGEEKVKEEEDRLDDELDETEKEEKKKKIAKISKLGRGFGGLGGMMRRRVIKKKKSPPKQVKVKNNDNEDEEDDVKKE